MLTIDNLHKQFGQTKALAGVSLTVNQGETVVLMGPSGCGKSTTIRAVNRLIEPDRGAVYLGGQNVLALADEPLRKLRQRIGFVFQHFNLIARLSVLENVMLGLVLNGVAREEAEVKAKAALLKVGLEHCCAQQTTALSGGQQQRVGIARALAPEPDVMLWDEPTASLDPILVREVLVVMEELSRYQAAAMLVVTHEIPFALRAADRIILMDNGQVVEEGAPQTLFTAPASSIGQTYKELIEYQLSTGTAMLKGRRIA